MIETPWYLQPDIIFPTVYCYNAKTGEFISEEHSSPSPLEAGVFVAPANSVNVAPPKVGKHQKQIWNGEKWEIAPDFRGETWFNKKGAPFVIKDLGDPEENGLTTTRPTPPLPSLPELKNTLKKDVDSAAEYERSKYITNGIGQSMIYEEKYKQAEDYAKNYTSNQQTPDKIPQQKEDDYLLLKASLGIDGDTLIEVAETIMHSRALWQRIGAAIEATRLEAKKKIDYAESITEAQSIFDSIQWPSLS